MDGVVNLLKPPGMSSQAAVTAVRRLFDVRRAGHAGTLDPGACGVLVVCLGRATKLSSYLMGSSKEYIAELLVGVATDTLDTYGKVTDTSDKTVTAAQIEAAARDCTGWIEQAPPSYSAVKLHGKPLYKYAREGIEAQKPARRVFVEDIALVRQSDVNRFLFRITCSKGTYVRTLLADIASNLGVVGCVSFLERTACGTFRVHDAVTLSELERAHKIDCSRFIVPPENALTIPEIILPAHLYDILLTGSSIDPNKVRDLVVLPERAYRIYCGGEFFGVGELDNGKLRLTARIKIE